MKKLVGCLGFVLISLMISSYAVEKEKADEKYEYWKTELDKLNQEYADIVKK